MLWASGVLATALVVAPLARSTHVEGDLRIAAVQGGGPQGLRAVEGGVVETWRVFDRHLRLTDQIAPGSADLVLWPENTVSVHGHFDGSWQQAWLRDEAARLRAPITVGMVDDAPGSPSDEVLRFHNTQIVIGPGGQTLSSTAKIRRVPFGEFVPMRSLLHSLGLPTDLVPKDAIAGHGPPVLDLPARTAEGGTRAAVAISWEIFFSDTVRDGVRHGGTVILNPTNGSSYRGTVLQSQQVASSRLRALETDRFVVQSAPTGFSAVIGPDGTVERRLGIGTADVLRATVELRSGQTWYVRLGDHAVAVAAAVMFAIAVAPEVVASGRRRRRRSDGHRPA